MAKQYFIILILIGSSVSGLFSQIKPKGHKLTPNELEQAEGLKRRSAYLSEFALLTADFDVKKAENDYIENENIDKKIFPLSNYIDGMKLVHYNAKKGQASTLSIPLLNWKTVAPIDLKECPPNKNFNLNNLGTPFSNWVVTGSSGNKSLICAANPPGGGANDDYFCPSTISNPGAFVPGTSCINGGDFIINGPSIILPTNTAVTVTGPAPVNACSNLNNSVNLHTSGNDALLTSLGVTLPTVYPNFAGGVSARIGNDCNGANLDRVKYKYKVTQTNSLVKFAYAIVFDDGGFPTNHDCGIQPFFMLRILDSASGQPITGGCAKFSVSAASAIFDTAFRSVPPNASITTQCVRYKKWTEVPIDLSKYIDSIPVYFELTTGDCSFTGHMGYAYFDFECGNIDGEAAVCKSGDYACLNSPLPGAAYKWFGPLPSLTPLPDSVGGNTVKMCTNNVTIGDQFLVKVKNSFGCNVPVRVTISEIDTLTLQVTKNRFGCNDSLQGAAKALIISSRGQFSTQGPFVFNWSRLNGDSLDAILGTVSPNSTPLGYFFQQPTKGPFVLIARTLDSSCVIGPDTFSFDSVPNFFLSATALAPAVCKNDVVPIKTSIINGPPGNTYSYAWSPVADLKYVDASNTISNVPASGTDPGLATPFYKPGLAGYITKTIVVTDANKCKRSRTINFTVSNEEIPPFHIPDSLELICNWPDNNTALKTPIFNVTPLTPCSLAVGCPSPSVSTTLGSGISSNLATTNPTIVPGDINKKFIRMQFILKKSELLAAGLTPNAKLSSVFFNLIKPYSDTIVGGGRVLQNVSIGMACLPPATTAFPSTTFLTNPLSPLVTLDTFKIGSAGWFEFPFRAKITNGVYESRAFVWDGISNVLVDFKMKKPNTNSNTNNAEIEYTTTTPAAAISTLFYNGSTAPGTAANDPTANQKRPNVRFNYCTNNPDTLNYKFAWTSNRTDWSYNKTALPNGDFTFNGTGVFPLKLNVKTKNNLCSKSDSVVVFVRPKVVFEPLSGSVLDSFCSTDNSVTLLFQVKPKLNGAFSGPGISNSLLGIFSPNPNVSNGALLMPLDNNIKFKITDSIKYIVKGKLCVDSALYVIRDFPFQSAKILNKNLVDTVLCIYEKGETLVLSPGGYINPSFLNTSNFEIKPLDFGPGTHKITYNSIGECKDKDSMTIRIVKKPIIALAATNNNACVPATVRYTANVNPTKGYYEWSSLDFDTVRKSGLDYLYTTGGIKNVNFKFVDDDNCTADAKINVNLKPSPIADFLLPKNNTVLLDPVLILNNQTINIEGNTYAWAINNNYFDNQYNSQYTFNTVGEYVIQMKVTNFYNCSDSISKNFSITQQPQFFVPNAFNPKSNVTENRKLIAKSFAVKSELFTLYVYDRWGKEVYKTNDINFAWGGTETSSGKLCEPGIYVWKANFIDINNTTQSSTGSVTILR
jgi:hypothetical protein